MTVDLRTHASPYSLYEFDEEHPGLLWIVISHVDIPAGKFGQHRYFQQIRGSKLFVNCADNSWYQQGIDETVDSLEALVEALVWLVPNYERVRVVGHSMGAYLALILQHLADVEYAIVSSPEPILMVDNSRSERNGVRPVPHWNDLVATFTSRTRCAPGLTLYGGYDPVDAYFLAKLEEHSSLYRSLYVAPHHHGVTEYMTGNRQYLQLLENPFDTAETMRREKLLFHASDLGAKYAFRDMNRLDALMRKKADPKRIAKLIARRKKWNNPGWLLLCASASIQSKDLDAALAYLERALDPDSLYIEPVLAYARVLAFQKNESAIDRFAQDLANYRLRGAHRTLVYEALGRAEREPATTS